MTEILIDWVISPKDLQVVFERPCTYYIPMRHVVTLFGGDGGTDLVCWKLMRIVDVFSSKLMTCGQEVWSSNDQQLSPASPLAASISASKSYWLASPGSWYSFWGRLSVWRTKDQNRRMKATFEAAEAKAEAAEKCIIAVVKVLHNLDALFRGCWG